MSERESALSPGNVLRRLPVFVLILALVPALARAEVQPVLKGEPAPLTGLVMDEATFMRYAGQQVDLATCKVEKDAASAQVQACATSTAPTSILPSSGYFWLGVGSGIVLTVAAIFGATQLVKATK